MATATAASSSLFLVLLLAGCGPRTDVRLLQQRLDELSTRTPQEAPRPVLGVRFTSEQGIIVEPPGTKAAAVANVDGDSYGWFLLAFRGARLTPGSFEVREDGRRIEFEAQKGTTYAVLLSVVTGGLQKTYQAFWDYGGPVDPDPPVDPPPPDLPPLPEMGVLAVQWAQGMSVAAKAQAVRIGGNFQLVGGKLAAGGFAPGDYREQSNKAIAELKGLNGRLHEDWLAWEQKWVAEMTIRVDSGKIPKTVQGVGQSFIDVGLGLVEVRP